MPDLPIQGSRTNKRKREEHYLERFPVYKVLADVESLDDASCSTSTTLAALRAAGMPSPDLSAYARRVDFIVSHARGRVLEIGAATGNITRHLVRNPAVTSIVAVEPMTVYADYLRSLALRGVTVVTGDSLTAPLSGRFDTVVLAEIVEHMDDLEEACLRRRLRDLLNPHAIVVVTTPVGFMPDPDHVRGFSRAALLERIESSYGPVFVHRDNGVQQFVAARWRQQPHSGPRVSVLLPTWNHADLLPASVSSALRQTYRDFELVIVDDGSTDETPEVLGRLDDVRCRIVRVEHGGLATALNVATCLARGELITWTSADNWCHDRWLESLVAALDARQSAAFAATGFQFVDENGISMGDHVLKDPCVVGIACQNPGLASFMYRASLVGEVGLYDPGLSGAEDWDYWTRLVIGRDLVYVPAVLYYYRVHANSLSSRDTTQVAAAAREVLRRSIHRLGTPVNLTRLYPSLTTCLDQKAATADATWELAVRVLRSAWADATLARPILELAVEHCGEPRMQVALAALEGWEGNWDGAKARLDGSRAGPDLHQVRAIADCLARRDAAGLRLAAPTPGEETSELVARERARYLWRPN